MSMFGDISPKDLFNVQEQLEQQLKAKGEGPLLEDAAIAGIPKWMTERLEQAQVEFKSKGGCKGCGSQVLAVHNPNCPIAANDLY